MIIINFQTSNESHDIKEQLLRLTNGSGGTFSNYIFYFNEELDYYDYLVVFESIPTKVKVKIAKEKTIFIAGEASSIRNYNQRFLNQFGHIVTCQDRIKHNSKFLKSPGHTWFSKKSYDELMSLESIPKTKLLSIVVSNKASTKGHRDRLDFCLKLKEKLGDKVDLFGRGFNEFDDKWDVIAPYKYSIALENSIEEHWITEKLGDCYTSHTFPFYMGAPNVHEYYNPKSYELIDIYDFEKSLKRIESILDDIMHYERHLEYLKEAKYDYLNKHSMIPMICNFIDEHCSKDVKNNFPKELIIYPHSNNILQKIRNYILKIVKRYFNA